MGTQGSERSELAWLDERETITVTELARACALSADELEELVGYGALAPLAATPPEPVFSARCVMPLRQAARLRRDLDLDLFSVSLLLGLIERIDGLESELRSLRARAHR
jgi:chaperone modulatory protein CbpM